MPTHASRLTRVGGLRFFSSPMDSGATVRVMLRVEVLEDFSLISESASILSSSSEPSRVTDPYRCGAVRSPPPFVKDLGAIVTTLEYFDACASLGKVFRKRAFQKRKSDGFVGLHAAPRAAGGRRGRQRLLVTRPSPQLLKLNVPIVPASLPALRPTCQRPHESSCGSARVALGYWAQ